MMKNKKHLALLVSIIIVFSFIIGLTIYISNKYDEHHTFKSVNFNSGKPSILNCPKTAISGSNLEKHFLTKWFLDSVQYSSINEIKAVLNWMDSLNQDKSSNQQFLASVLTDSLQNKLKHSFNLYNPDSLNAILFWAGKMKAYSEVDPDYQLFFDVVSSYWINFVSNNLSKLTEDNSSLKYKFKFKYLVSVCAQNLNQPNIKVSNTEKIINYTIEGRWWYLWDRFIGGTSIIFKIVVFLFGSLIIFSFYCLFLFLRKKL